MGDAVKPPDRAAQITQHLPKDRKGNAIAIGDRVWYYGCGVKLNPSVHGYNPMVLVCELPVTAIGPDFIFAGDSLIPIPSEQVYLHLRDAFQVMSAAVGDRHPPASKGKARTDVRA